MGFGSVCYGTLSPKKAGQCPGTYCFLPRAWHTVTPQQPFQDHDLISSSLAQTKDTASPSPSGADPKWLMSVISSTARGSLLQSGG